MAPPLAITTAFALSFMDATAARCFSEGGPGTCLRQPNRSICPCPNGATAAILRQWCRRRLWQSHLDWHGFCVHWASRNAGHCLHLVSANALSLAPALLHAKRPHEWGSGTFVVQDSIHSVGEIVAWQVFPLVADAHTFLPRLLV